MAKVSVIIPSYLSTYVSRTVEDLYAKATGEIEVIVLLDDYWPKPHIKDHNTLTIVHKGIRTGMRNSINLGVQIATGKYIMKLDDHCMIRQGFDEILQKDMEPNWVSIPQRYVIDAETWSVKGQATAYEYMAYPYVYTDRYRYGIGLYSTKWKGKDGNNPVNRGQNEYYYRENERKDILIDDIMIFHGSCYFTSKQHFLNIGGLEEKLFKTLYQEPQEISFKTWLTDGRVIVNKKAWYGHMWKTPEPDLPNTREYRLDISAMRQTERFGNWYWMNDQWPGAKHKMEWLIDKFWPIPGWPENWREERVKWNKDYPISQSE